MRPITNFERKFGRYGIHNLTIYIIICYVTGYVLELLLPDMLSYLALDPGMIFRGQVWRVLTWILIPPESLDIFTIIMLYFYYSIGSTLERTWGAFRYTLYIFSGVIFTIIGAFILYFVIGDAYSLMNLGMAFSTYYISTSILLAFAATYPDMEVLFWFIFPLKIKWMGILYGAMIIYNIITYLRHGAWPMVIPVVASLLNFIIFFLSTRNVARYKPSEVKRRRNFQKAVNPGRAPGRGSGTVSKHKCAVCGQTELDNPDLEFRFCSKCNGNYEYCQNHLFSHTHVK
ncbi:MAG: hypothetical protein HFH58_00060 [Lachnospiraceae bacterium]|jgi:hypothetical protein|nr:hypothetical protein [Lachnospiraceae bacterium]